MLVKPERGSGRQDRRRGPKARARRQAKNARVTAARREEAALVARVRSQCVTRDGYCLIGPLYSDCQGDSEWAHLHSHRRSRTTGQPLAARHDAAWTGMLCARHHADYDQHRIDLDVAPMQGLHGRVLVWLMQDRRRVAMLGWALRDRRQA